MRATDTNPIRLKKNLVIGELDAESDSVFLQKCFLESDIYRSLRDCDDVKSIVVGRVGSGKSAALIHLKEHADNVVWLDPQHFSFNYIENSTILKFVEELGVNLNIFYRLLWRHVLVVELLRARYQITDERKQKTALEVIESLVGVNEGKRKGLAYVREWENRFWEETETRVKEVTRKIENEIGASLGTDVPAVELQANARQSLSAEQKEEIKHRATKVVNEIQIRKLSEIVNLLAEDIFSDSQRLFYVLIDGLDTTWASTDTRCRLIRALIEEIKTFKQVRPVKILIALRRDLLAIVYDRTRDSGFQEEKYEALLAPLNWDEGELRELVERRVAHLFEHQYAKARVGFDDIFPSAKGRGGQSAFDFMIERSLRRPRDVIQFVNEALKIAANKSRVSWNDLQKAENVYSEKRLKSLFEEWSDVYPALRETIEILRGAPHQVSRSYFKGELIQRIETDLCGESDLDPCVALVQRSTDPNARVSEGDVVVRILQCLYQVGAVGIKADANDTFSWSYLDQPTMTEGEIKRSSHVRVHKMLWQALNIIPEVRAIEDRLR